MRTFALINVGWGSLVDVRVKSVSTVGPQMMLMMARVSRGVVWSRSRRQCDFIGGECRNSRKYNFHRIGWLILLCNCRFGVDRCGKASKGLDFHDADRFV